MAAGSTYTSIATTTLSTNTATVTFNSFSGYTDLILIANVKNPGAGAGFIQIRFNSDSGSNYSWTQLQGDTSTANSSRASNQTYLKPGIVGNSSQNFTTNIIQIMNYSNTTINKTILSKIAWEEAVVTRIGLWKSTSAITSITLTVDAGSAEYITGSTFTLYGITAA